MLGGASRILGAEVAGSGGSVDSSDASRFHAGSFASASPLSGGVRRPAQSAQAVAAPPMASPINKPFINAAVTTADARTSFIDISLEPNRRTARQCLTIPLGFRPHPAVCRPAWLHGSARHGFAGRVVVLGWEMEGIWVSDGDGCRPLNRPHETRKSSNRAEAPALSGRPRYSGEPPPI